MKNNKGYTLVELLVAMAIFAIVMLEIFAMMNHSSRLYLNGTYEVELQAEAQQIVQQMEELLIDANVSVNIIPNPLVSVDNIEIVNHDVTYLIEYEPLPSVSYGNLYLSTSSAAYSETHVLMGEYVESISLNMAEYTTTSRVTLDVVMRNNKYSYTTSKDIYLRNDIGISGNHAPHTTGGSYDDELDVLRFKDYNLTALYGSEYDFAWSAEALAASCGNQYTLSGASGSTWTLKASNYLNSRFNEIGGDFLIEATNRSDPTDTFVIKVYTNPVSVGTDGFGLIVMDGGANYPHLTPVRVEGVCLSAATQITWTFQAFDEDAGGTFNPNHPSQTGSTYTFNNNGNVRYNGADYYVQLDGLSAQIDDLTNSIHFTGKFMQYGGYYNLLQAGGMLMMETKFEFPTPGRTLYVYSYPVITNGTAMSTAQAAAFWGFCNSHKSTYN